MINRPLAPSFVFFAVLGTLLSIGLPARGQQQEPPPAQQQQPTPAQKQQPAQQAPQGPAEQTQPGATSKDEQEKKLEEKTGVSNDRLFWTLPNFLTVENASHIPPLTAGKKFKVVARTSFDFVEYPYVGFLAGISQAQNSEPGYGQGAAGYGKRYGAAFADNTIENFVTGAVLPSLLRQDPRYYQLGRGGFLHRAGYSISRLFITRSDSGHSQFDVSEIAGAAIAAGISNAYHPAGDRTVANTMSVWGTQMGWDTVATVVKEFWPDIRRKVHKKKVEAQTLVNEPTAQKSQ
jgi:hypothetical protein